MHNMTIEIPYNTWQPLSVAEVTTLFADAPFSWGLAGGYAVEQFLGTAIREHDDIDIVIFRDEQHQVQHWLADWLLYAADPPGTLRLWSPDEYLSYGIHDIWGHRNGAAAWQLQLMMLESEGSDWFSRRDRRIRGQRDDLIVRYNGLPCVRIEVQLLYKAKGCRPKDTLDFQTSLPLLSGEAKRWLRESLRLAHPEGHIWMQSL
jgi:hypothetical protein